MHSKNSRENVSDPVQAFGECVYPLMFGGEKPGQDKFDKLKEVLGWLETFVADDKVTEINPHCCYS